jgi:hypothetical protein
MNAVSCARRGPERSRRRYTLARVALARVRIDVELQVGSVRRSRADIPPDECTFGALTPDGYHTETLTGGYVDISDPDPGDIRLPDIAAGLANTCRGAGQMPFFSVAEHAVLVSRRLRDLGHPPGVVLAGLHHDDPEAYLHDLTKPLKQLLARASRRPWPLGFLRPGPSYADLEAAMWEAIRFGLGLGECDIHHPAVKEADHWALAAECYHLRRSRGRTWFCHGAYCPERDPLRLGMCPADAEALWLHEHHRVLGALEAGRTHQDARALTADGEGAVAPQCVEARERKAGLARDARRMSAHLHDLIMAVASAVLLVAMLPVVWRAALGLRLRLPGCGRRRCRLGIRRTSRRAPRPGR